MYGFRKLYIDVITDDQVVVIAYLTQTSILGVSIPQAMVELYWPDGKRETHRASAPFTSIPSPAALGERPLRFNLADGPVDFFIDVNHWSKTSEMEQICRGMSWSVVAARTSVRVNWRNRPGRLEWNGTGYVDLIQIEHLFRRLAVSEVEWGRIHFRDASLVFNSVRFRDGNTWQSLDVWTDSNGISTCRHLGAFSKDSALDLTFDAGSVSMSPVRLLHHGRAIDRERFPGTAERAVIGLTTGPLYETRWLSEATALIDGQSMSGWALHERVRAPSRVTETHVPDSEPAEESVMIADTIVE